MSTAEYGPHDPRKHAELHPLTDLSWLEKGAQFPPACEKPRMNRYAFNRLLWKGNHEFIYNDAWELLPKKAREDLEIVLNWHKRVTTLWADLMLSVPPRFLDGVEDEDRAGKKRGESDAEESSGDSSDEEKRARQDAIDRIVGKDDNAYVNTLYKAAIDRSRYGDGVIKIALEEDGAQFWSRTPAQWFPVVDPNNLSKYTQHVLAWTFKRTDMTFLRVEIHEPGIIQHRVYRMEGNMIGDELQIRSFLPDVPTGIEYTKVDDFLVVPFQGLVPSDEIYGMDDYGDIDGLVYAMEQRAAQINRILSKHSDPIMYGPPEAVVRDESTGISSFQVPGYIPVDSDDDDAIPGYVSWEAHMESQFAEFDTLLKQLYFISETSPAAFGQLESGLAESGSALRRLMQAPLAKVARIAMTFDPAAKRAIKIAAALERKNGRDTPEIPTVNIQWQDGLPKDPKETAETEATRLSSGNTSLVSSIMRADGSTKEEALAEIERMDEEAQAAQERTLAEAEANAEIAARYAPPSEAKQPASGTP